MNVFAYIVYVFKKCFSHFNKKNIIIQEGPIVEDNNLSLFDIIISTWRNLDAKILIPFLDKNFQYNSAWISNTLSKKEYEEYLPQKFDTLKKSKTIPLVEVIEELGEKRILIIQGDIKCVLEYVYHNDKIIHIQMRPYFKINVVDDSEWGNYENSYQDILPIAVQVAQENIQKYVSDIGLDKSKYAWIQSNLHSPSFQHLCFRYETHIYSILLAIHGYIDKEGIEIESVVVHKRDYDNLLNECKKYNLTPCIVPIYARSQTTIIGECPIINILTKERINLKLIDDKGRVPMSKWEIHNMGINFIIQYIIKQGWEICSYCDIPEIFPQIVFERNGKLSYVIVRAIPIGHRKQPFIIFKNNLLKLSDLDGYFADVQFSSSAAVLYDEHDNIVPLSERDGDKDVWMWRGDGFYCNFSGFQEIEKAIVDNDFIKIDDSEIYDLEEK